MLVALGGGGKRPSGVLVYMCGRGKSGSEEAGHGDQDDGEGACVS